MTTFTRRQVIELLEIEENFLLELEREEIVQVDSPDRASFTEHMLERARVAHNLVHELEVNLPGAAIILKLREDVAHLRRQLAELAAELERRGGAG